nr:reverse transcriptase domain-containing protein [Tanacetum cinerariifolium]
MHTRSSYLPVKSPPNPSTSNPKRRNHRRSKQPFILEESPVDTMADQRTMAELLCEPTEGYTEAIVVPSILAEQFELKHSVINMMTSDQFFRLEKECENTETRGCPYDHIHWHGIDTKIILHACPHHGFTELHQLDTFYNNLNLANQDSLNSAAGGNLLERRTQDVLTIIENKSKGNSVYRPPSMANQIRPPGFAQSNVQNNQTGLANLKDITEATISIQNNLIKPPTQQNQVVPLRSGSLPSNTIANPKGELKAIITQNGIVLDGPSIPIPPPFINPEEDERVKETLTDQDLAEYTIKVPPHFVQKSKPPSQRNFVVHQRDPLHPNIPYPARMLKQKWQ